MYEDIVAIRVQVAEIAVRLAGLPCDQEAARLDKVAGELENVRMAIAGDAPKLSLLWQVLVTILTATAAGIAGAALAAMQLGGR